MAADSQAWEGSPIIEPLLVFPVECSSNLQAVTYLHPSRL